MSSRRKQSKPKSFGMNADETEVGEAGTAAAGVTQVLAVNDANKENGEGAKKLEVEANNQGEEQSESSGDGQSQDEGEEKTAESESLKRKRSSDEEEDDDEEDDDEEGVELDDTGTDLANLMDELDDDGEETNEESWNSTPPIGRKYFDEITDVNITSLIVNRARDDSSNIDPSLLAFKCKVCHKGFKHRRSLNRHVKLHSGEKNFKCPYCTSAFARSDHLKAHLRTHNNSKPYKCSVCQCGYNTQAALKVHIAHHHSKSKFRCTLCDNLEFHSQLALEGHIYTKHSKENTELSLEDDYEASVIKKARISHEKSENNDVENGVSLETLEEMLMNEESRSLQHRELETMQEEDENQEAIKTDNYNEEEIVLNNNNNQSEDDVIFEESNQQSRQQTQFKRIAPKIAPYNQINTRVLSLRLSQPPPQHLPPPPPLLSPAQPPPPSQQQQQQQPRPGATVNPMPQITKIPPNFPPRNMPYQQQQQQQQQPNTYCEMCNARFSSVESYVAHMRNCHPNVPFQSPASNKMPYLTSILAKAPPKPNNAGIIIPLVPPPPLPQQPSTLPPIKPQTQCSIPNCNCDADDYFVLKETHYSCAQCNMTFFKIADYMAHLKQEHCVEVFRCILCKQMQLFDNLHLLKEHFFQVHQSHKYDLYRCRLCVNSSSSTGVFHHIDELYAHVQAVHHQAPHPRPRQSHFPPAQIHPQQQQHPQQPQQPPPYQPTFSEQARPTFVNKCFKCSYCDSDFAQQNSLNQHIQMVHVKANVNANSQNGATSSFPCQYCRNTFSNRAQLERHLRIHVSSIDLKCNICDQKFESQDALGQHKLTHCKTFSDKPAEAVAERSSNGEETPSSPTAICVYCKESIENEAQFKEHFKRHNNIGQAPHQNQTRPNSFVCIVCRQTLSSTSEYNLHLRHHLRRVKAAAPPQTAAPLDQEAKDTSVKEPTNNESEASSTNGAGSKLRCSKCLVKFEVWQELADHIAEAHPSTTTSNTPTTTTTTTITTIDKPAIKDERRSPESTLLDDSNTPAQNPPTDLCEICSSKFDSSSKLASHLIVKHEFSNTNGALTCPVCDEGFARAELLLAHTSQHGPAARIYKCTQCPASFVFKAQLINHSFAHGDSRARTQFRAVAPLTPNQPRRPANQIQLTAVVPNLCKSAPTNINTLPRQQQQQQQQQPRQFTPTIAPNLHRFKCAECCVDFGTFRLYQQHAQSIHGRTVIFNAASSPTFLHSNNLTSNIDNRCFTCSACFKVFATQRNLTLHAKVHLGIKPYQCSTCQKRFLRRENLLSHIKCHLNDRPFECPLCGRRFRRKSHVHSHLDVHIKSKNHNCSECPQIFETLQMFIRHMINDHLIKDKELMDMVKERYSGEAIYPNGSGYMSPRLTMHAQDEEELNEEANEGDEMNDEEYRQEEDESLLEGGNDGLEGEVQADFDSNEIDSTGSNQNYDDNQNEMNYDELSDLLESTIHAN